MLPIHERAWTENRRCPPRRPAASAVKTHRMQNRADTRAGMRLASRHTPRRRCARPGDLIALAPTRGPPPNGDWAIEEDCHAGDIRRGHRPDAAARDRNWPGAGISVVRAVQHAG